MIVGRTFVVRCDQSVSSPASSASDASPSPTIWWYTNVRTRARRSRSRAKDAANYSRGRTICDSIGELYSFLREISVVVTRREAERQFVNKSIFYLSYISSQMLSVSLSDDRDAAFCWFLTTAAARVAVAQTIFLSETMHQIKVIFNVSNCVKNACGWCVTSECLVSLSKYYMQHIILFGVRLFCCVFGWFCGTESRGKHRVN